MASLSPLQGVLGQRRAAHLLRRASYRYTKSKVDELATLTAADAVTALLALQPLQLDQPLYSPDLNTAPVTWINPPQPQNTPLPFGVEDFVLRRYVIGWWVNEALHDPGIGHKMSFFFHQYLAADIQSGGSAVYFDYLMLLRWGALGNFKKLATKIVVDNVMLRYLNNDQNNKANPNENFAREFLELFTIGKGEAAGPGDYTNYTEDDIVQAARVFTGFNHAFRNLNSDPETGIPAGKPYTQGHDFGAKTFSARFDATMIQASGNDEAAMQQELDDFVSMVFSKDETARNLCRRLYRFFLTRQISAEAENDIIGPLAQTLRDNDFELMPVLSQLLQSEHFFDADDADADDEIVGALIKSPLELALQAISFFGMPIPDPVSQNLIHYRRFFDAAVVQRIMDLSGMSIFLPPDVAGYSAYHQDPIFNRQWFNSSSIIARYKMPEMLLTGKEVLDGNQNIGTKLDVAPWLRDSGTVSDPSDSYILVKELLGYLAPEEVDTDRFNYFLIEIFLDGLPPADWTYEWQNYLSSGNDFEVRIPLRRLVTAIMYSPEYQVF